MNALRLPGHRPAARDIVEDAIREFGASRVIWAALLAVLRGRLRRRARPPDAARLDAHLRRDVGLLAEPEAADWRRLMR